MISFLADESISGAILRGLRQRNPGIDLITAHEAGLKGLADPAVLDWAATRERLIATSDVQTMIAFAYDRVRAGLRMPGLVIATQDLEVGAVVEDLLIISECVDPGEWEG